MIAAQETGTVTEKSANDQTGSEKKLPKISGYEKVLLRRLAVYEKLLRETDLEDQYIKNISRTKRELEHYRQNVAPLIVSITNWHD